MEATLPDFLTQFKNNSEPHPLFNKSESPKVKFHKYVEPIVSNGEQLFQESGTLNISEDGEQTFYKKHNNRIIVNWFIGTNSSPKNYELNKMIEELYEKGYKNVTYDVTKIKLFTPNWFQKNILRQNSFKYFDYSDEHGFLFEADEIVKKDIDTIGWSHI